MSTPPPLIMYSSVTDHCSRPPYTMMPAETNRVIPVPTNEVTKSNPNRSPGSAIDQYSTNISFKLRAATARPDHVRAHRNSSAPARFRDNHHPSRSVIVMNFLQATLLFADRASVAV